MPDGNMEFTRFWIPETRFVRQPSTAMPGLLLIGLTQFERTQQTQAQTHVIPFRKIADDFDFIDVLIHIRRECSQTTGIIAVLPEEFIKGNDQFMRPVAFPFLTNLP